MIALPPHPSIAQGTYYERGLWIAARETLAMTMAKAVSVNWAMLSEKARDTYRKQAQTLMTEGTSE